MSVLSFQNLQRSSKTAGIVKNAQETATDIGCLK